jgi:predicted HAD superfamily Cof-like phosphohydrolase
MQKVKAFHVLYDAPIHHEPTPDLPQMDDARLGLRLGLIEEEFNELKEATGSRDIVEMADALGDIIYVVCGFAIEAGIDLDAVVQEIQASNMTKMGEDGNPVRREDGKILKGPNYRKPDIAAVLKLG